LLWLTARNRPDRASKTLAREINTWGAHRFAGRASSSASGRRLIVSRSRFRNQVVLVTGGAQGIGKEIATAFAEEHASVVIVDKDKEALDSCLCELSSSGLDVIGIEADLSHVDQI